MKKLWKNNTFWEIVGYSSLALCVLGQICVGYVYLFAQVLYLVSNVLGIVRDFALDLPRANKVRDAVFIGITLALIVIKIF